MFIDIKQRLAESQLIELLSYSVFPDEHILQQVVEQYRSNEQFEIYGFEVEGEIIGLLGMSMNEHHTIMIQHLSVHPDYRGLGYGRGLLVEIIHKRNAKQLMAETDEHAVDFYRNVGFTVISLGDKHPGVERFECKFVV